MGIRGEDIASGDSHGYLFDNNTISDINNCGIFVTPQFTSGTISNNTITRVGLIPGATYSHDSGFSPYAYEGITINEVFSSDNTIVEYNTLDSIGYSGIMFTGTNIYVRYNFINHYCITLTDGGGIYTSFAPLSCPDTAHYVDELLDSTYQVGYIIKNVIMNGMSNISGVSGESVHAPGVYTDGYSYGITTDSNTVINGNPYAFYSNGNRRGFIKNNTFFNCAKMIGLSQILETQYWNADSIDLLKNLRITNNILLCKDTT
jgi:hypothetical protein